MAVVALVDVDDAAAVLGHHVRDREGEQARCDGHPVCSPIDRHDGATLECGEAGARHARRDRVGRRLREVVRAVVDRAGLEVDADRRERRTARGRPREVVVGIEVADFLGRPRDIEVDARARELERPGGVIDVVDRAVERVHDADRRLWDLARCRVVY